MWTGTQHRHSISLPYPGGGPGHIVPSGQSDPHVHPVNDLMTAPPCSAVPLGMNLDAGFSQTRRAQARQASLHRHATGDIMQAENLPHWLFRQRSPKTERRRHREPPSMRGMTASPVSAHRIREPSALAPHPQRRRCGSRLSRCRLLGCGSICHNHPPGHEALGTFRYHGPSRNCKCNWPWWIRTTIDGS